MDQNSFAHVRKHTLGMFSHWQVRTRWTASYKQPLISTLYFIHKNNFVLMGNIKADNSRYRTSLNKKTFKSQSPKWWTEGKCSTTAGISQYVHFCVQQGLFFFFFLNSHPWIGQNSSGSPTSSSGITKPSYWKTENHRTQRAKDSLVWDLL